MWLEELALEEMLCGLNTWCSLSDDKGEEDVNEQIFEGTERQAYLKDTDRADQEVMGQKGGRKFMKTGIFPGSERCIFSFCRNLSK